MRKKNEINNQTANFINIAREEEKKQRKPTVLTTVPDKVEYMHTKKKREKKTRVFVLIRSDRVCEHSTLSENRQRAEVDMHRVRVGVVVTCQQREIER
jgi:hypothetical protein